MNEKTKSLIKNLNYTVTANFLVLIISVVLNLVVPRFLGVREYGFWQLYVFYSGYVGFFHFGWIDGIYLKIGGEEYDNLDKRNLGSQFYYLFIFQLILALALSTYTTIFIPEINRKVIWYATASMLIISNLRNFILFILQSTNRIKEYASLSRNDRYIYLISSMCYLLLGGRDFKILIVLDVISRLLITIWGIGQIKDIVESKNNSFKLTVLEVKDNIRVGSNLMLGNIASMLILGVSRFFVERHWSIETFGKLSFALNISNMFMIFINSVSIVLYPVLRRAEKGNLPNLYLKVRTIFVPLTLGILLFFNPIRILLQWWLPEYKESLFFMGILFPIIIYEGRVSLLVNTYLKTIRKEKIILYSNIFSLVVMIVTTLSSIYVFNKINLVVLSITLCLALRCIAAEIMLAKELRIKVVKENTIEFIIALCFILSNFYLSSWNSFIIYLVVFIIYILIKHKKIKISLSYLVKLTKSSVSK